MFWQLPSSGTGAVFNPYFQIFPTMKKYLLIFTSILFLWGCIAEDRTECANPRGVFVSLTVRPERMSSVTRTTDETAIRDLNFYLYDDNGNVVLHRYQTSATLRFECLPGDYRMCIAANLGRDLGENPTWEDFTVTHADKYDVLPMAYEGDITIIPSADGVLTLPQTGDEKGLVFAVILLVSGVAAVGAAMAFRKIRR